MQGADWAEKYPDCGLPQQSPINLLDPVTEFGRAYEIHDPEDDQTFSEYSDLGPTTIDFRPQEYTVSTSLEDSEG